MHEQMVVAVEHLQYLFDVLAQQGYQVVGPTVRDGAIVYEAIDAVEELPIGWTDQHDGGHYELVKRDDRALFGYVVSPHSWKKFLHTGAAFMANERQEDGFHHR